VDTAFTAKEMLRHVGVELIKRQLALALQQMKVSTGTWQPSIPFLVRNRTLPQ
jgi:hypothetical protein